jgi:hypothetical protein
VAFGREQTEQLTVTVAGPSGVVDTPTGQVAITAGSVTVATVNLAGGSGTIMLSATQLPAGIYHLIASYGGDLTNDTSVSGVQTLTVLPRPARGTR